MILSNCPQSYYLCDALGVPVYLIATNELPIEPMYYSLLLFACSKVRSQTIIEDIVKNEAVHYLSYAFQLHPKITVEVLEMAKRRNQIEENLKIIARDMGPRLIPFMNLEDIFRELTPEQLLEGLEATQLLEKLPLEDIVNHLSDEDRQALRQLLDDKDNGA